MQTRTTAGWFPFLFWLTVVAGAAPTCAGAPPLPEGSAPAPVAVGHFPSRLYAVIWRNWQLVEPARLARLLETSEDRVTELAASMGLPPPTAVSPQWRRRGYITLVRRNWHLLPYDQLLQLIDMSPQEFAVALREDDFLYIKLGNCKPHCEPVHYQEPSAAERQRAAEIRDAVQRYFGQKLAAPAEPPFAFVRALSASPPPARVAPVAPAAAGRLQLRFIYSYFGTFGDPLWDPSLDPYPDGLLAALAANGVNGVWLHVVLRQLAPGGADFPEFGAGHERRLETLRAIVARARRHGIDVYLYMNEPRAMPVAFFAARPEMGGVTEGDYRTLCTSQPRVRAWLEDALAYVFTQVPDLGGVFTITASENLTNCASHGRRQMCPRCAARNSDDIIAEVNATIERGVHRGNPRAKVLVWDWGWNNHGDARGIIAQLPRNTWLMSVSEWALPIERGGVKSRIGEYSLSAVGPGPRALGHWQAARQAGLRTVAKVQLNNTWELSAVPYLPVMDLVAQHCFNLAHQDIDGMMLSWSLGGYPSPNLQIAQRFAQRSDASVDEVLNGLARDRYGPGAAAARRAWAAFSQGFANYPFDGQVVYQGPQQLGPANLLYPRATGYHATMVGIPYDDLDGWRGPYPADVYIHQMHEVASGWADGLQSLAEAVSAAPPELRAAAEADLRVARAAGLHFASVVRQARFVQARDAWLDAARRSADRGPRTGEIAELLEAEIAAARELFDLARADSRIGFEASNHYYYVPLDLVEKVVNCDFLKSQFEAAK